jgi:hypothetical protein
VSLEVVLSRIADISAALAPPVGPLPAQPATSAPLDASAGARASTATPFATALQTAQGGGSGAVGIAQREVGQREEPPGSNNSARIAQYRSAVPGGGVGPWCAYFASWVAKQNGTPLGDNGQGFARVDDVWSWAERSGRAVPGGAGVKPSPGDLIIWDEHMGVVEAVNPDGSIRTIEGNSSDAVTRRTHPAGGDGAIGYVRLG